MQASVIIPTYDRRRSLLKLLDSLAGVSAEPDSFEVIVVDDGSPDADQQLTETPFPFPVRCLRQANQGSAAARNLGAEHAQGELLIFLDDDMVVEPGFVSGLLAEHRAYPDIIAMGSLRPFVVEEGSLFTRVYPFDQELLQQRVYLAGEAGSQREGEWVSFQECVTNNLSIRREAFFRIGGMQDVAGDGPTWWGDVDFGYRAELKGFRFRRSGLAFCTHCDQSVHDLASAAMRQYKAATLAVDLFRKFPALQDRLPMFRDMLPIDRKKDPAGLIARKLARKVASAWLSIRILSAIAWIFERLYPSPRQLRPLYRWILGGYVYHGYREGLRQHGQNSTTPSASLA